MPGCSALFVGRRQPRMVRGLALRTRVDQDFVVVGEGAGNLLERVRREAGLSQEELASRAGTSRTTLSAYEHGRESPTLATVDRLLGRAGFTLNAEPNVTFSEATAQRGRPFFVADRLWRLPIKAAFAEVVLSLGLNWSRPGTAFALGDRRQRARCYEVVLREGMPADLLRFVDSALLIDLWSEVVVPREIRAAWQPVIDEAIG